MEVAELGKGWFHKPLGGDMCAAILEVKSEKKFHLQNLSPIAKALVASLWQRLLRHSTLSKTDGANSD